MCMHLWSELAVQDHMYTKEGGTLGMVMDINNINRSIHLLLGIILLTTVAYSHVHPPKTLLHKFCEQPYTFSESCMCIVLLCQLLFQHSEHSGCALASGNDNLAQDNIIFILS